MRFYGNGVVWDAENDRRLCKFSRAARGEKGVFDTDNERICAELARRGYEHEGAQAVLIPNATPDMPVATPIPNAGPESVVVVPLSGTVTPNLGAKELREIGKELGLSFPASTKKTDMVDAINAKREAAK